MPVTATAAASRHRASQSQVRTGLLRPVAQLAAERGTGGDYALYLSVPPKAFPLVVRQLKQSGLADAPDPDPADSPPGPGGGWSSRSRPATTWTAPES